MSVTASTQIRWMLRLRSLAPNDVGSVPGLESVRHDTLATVLERAVEPDRRRRYDQSIPITRQSRTKRRTMHVPPWSICLI